MKLTIKVGTDNIAHTTITCERNEKFQEVLTALKICELEIKHQIDNRTKCPFYANDLILKMGLIEITSHQF